MIRIEENVPLRNMNTFGVNAVAEQLTTITDEADLDDLYQSGLTKKISLILGGGSNVLLVKNIPGLTLVNRLKGIRIEKESPDRVLVSAMGGVVWHELVQWSLHRNLGGLENLSLIPGTVGAAPIQNIGAYGVDLQMVFEKLEAFELPTGRRVTFHKTDCRFGYRDSRFKHEGRNRFLITKVYLNLTKNEHQLHLAYGAIREMLDRNGISNPTIRDIGNAVIAIRQSKLPDPAVIGNAGSFFKNPEIPAADFEALCKDFPGLVHYPGSEGTIKLSAGWLIEQCGWKGRRIGQAGCYDKQALVLINCGHATGAEILELAGLIRADVRKKFGIDLQPEINIL